VFVGLTRLRFRGFEDWGLSMNDSGDANVLSIRGLAWHQETITYDRSLFSVFKVYTRQFHKNHWKLQNWIDDSL
jgi:hypothetical protein